MPVNSNPLELEFRASISEIPAADWNSLARPNPSPFMEWEWLAALERSGSITPQNGWQPYHALLRRGKQTSAVAPLYLKSHSMGEFVFDFAWADVAEQMDVPYYPKLVGMSPATPSVCFRPLIAPTEEPDEVHSTLLAGIDVLLEELELGACAFNYVEEGFADEAERHGYIRWKHQNFIWENPGLRDFEDYLALFRKNQRRNIRRERASIAQQGLEIRVLQGAELTTELLSLMNSYYRKTNEQFGPWAARFLSNEFFPLLGEASVREFTERSVVIVAAYDPNAGPDPIALSFLVRKGEMLFGRYWGAAAFYENLHFELCYYRPIEWAITEGIRSFDPGIGSAHKVRRGFVAVPNYSMHRFRDPRMNALMGMHINRINEMEQQQIDSLNEMSPFSRSS